MRWYEFTRPKMDIGIYFRIQANSIKEAWARMSWFVVDPEKWILSLQKDEETLYLQFPKDEPYPIIQSSEESETK